MDQPPAPQSARSENVACRGGITATDVRNLDAMVEWLRRLRVKVNLGNAVLPGGLVVGSLYPTAVIVRDSEQNIALSTRWTPGAGVVNSSTGHTNIVKDEKDNLDNWCGHRDALLREIVKFDAGSPGRQSKHWAQEHRERLPRKCEKKDIVRDYRENVKNIVSN